jgi:hypothetical protein
MTTAARLGGLTLLVLCVAPPRPPRPGPPHHREGRATPLTAGYDYEIGNDVLGDRHPPRGGGSSPLVWTPDGRDPIVATTERGRSNLVRIDLATRRVEPLTTGGHEILAYTATPDAARFAVTVGDPRRLPEVYLFEPGSRLVQLTHHNDSLLAALQLSEPEEIWYRRFDGRRINGWVFKPPDFDPGRRYPLILDGGGLLTNWAITRTPRFAAAVSQRSVADWSAFWYTADFALFTPFWFRSAPFRDPGEFLVAGPLRRSDHDPPLADRGGRRSPDALGPRRRGHVPRPQAPAETGRDGDLPR